MTIYDEILALDFATLGPRSACTYSSPCVVGALLTQEERDAIVKAGLDTQRVGLINMQGLLPERLRPHVEFLQQIQRRWDNPGKYTIDQMREYVEACRT